MKLQNDLTKGNVKKMVIAFVLPYLLSCFLQTFYGLCDLLIVGLYNAEETTTAVSIGSQVMHMLTVMIVGIAMGATVEIGRSVGGGDKDRAKRVIGSTTVFFVIFSIVGTILLLVGTRGITAIMSTPVEAVVGTNWYLMICFMGLPFIVAYNVISSIYRGVGDSKSPMIFVMIACAVNIAADFLFIGAFHFGAAGAALGTVIGQAVSVIVALIAMKKIGLGFELSLKDLRCKKEELIAFLKVGLPISFQDGLIQVAFIVITIIANRRGLVDATAVGVVEKLISFMFLVPSAFLSAISAITAQNMGAGKADRARKALGFALLVTVCWGAICALYCQFLPGTLVFLFRREPEIILAGSQYLRAYSFDCMFAAVHFCFSGYFCGNQKSIISFIHNILSVMLVRIPGAYLASMYFPETLYPMGLAAPLGSLFSVLICVGFFLVEILREKKEVQS